MAACLAISAQRRTNVPALWRIIQQHVPACASDAAGAAAPHGTPHGRAGASTPSSVPASPRFEWSKVGDDWEVEGSTVIASGMLADERYAVGSKLVLTGKTTFTFTINKVFYPDAHMFLGVCEITDDPEKAETYAFSPATGNLYNGHKLNEHGDEKQKAHLMADPKADLCGKQEGSIITCYVDMDAKTQLLKIALLPMVKANAEEVEKAITDAGYEPVERYWLEADKLRTTTFASVKKSK